MLMQNIASGEVREVDPPANKAHLWAPYVAPSAEPMTLSSYKALLRERIDADAEQARLKYITAGSGQALEYQQVADEARAFAEGKGEYPMLQASVTAGEASSLAEAAALVVKRNSAWAAVGASIRQLRISAKLAVNAATTEADALAASKVVWP